MNIIRTKAISGQTVSVWAAASAFRSKLTATLAPSSARRRQIARPMPRAPPVTSAVLPSKMRVLILVPLPPLPDERTHQVGGVVGTDADPGVLLDLPRDSLELPLPFLP